VGRGWATHGAFRRRRRYLEAWAQVVEWQGSDGREMPQPCDARHTRPRMDRRDGADEKEGGAARR